MKTNIFDLLRAEVGRLIVSCFNCQPYEDGQPVWMDEPACLDDLFDRHRVPELMRARLAHRLRCPACNNRLEQYSIVGTELVYAESSAHRKEAA